jgi:hypothetical protein
MLDYFKMMSYVFLSSCKILNKFFIGYFNLFICNKININSLDEGRYLENKKAKFRSHWQ